MAASHSDRVPQEIASCGTFFFGISAPYPYINTADRHLRNEAAVHFSLLQNFQFGIQKIEFIQKC